MNAAYIHTRVPVELLFTEFIPQERRSVIDHFTEAWYDYHKRYASRSIARLTPHIQLFRYFMGQEQSPALYLEWYRMIHTTRQLQPPLTDAALLQERRAVYDHMLAMLKDSQARFEQFPALVRYNRDRGYFNIADGHHRIVFLYCHGIRHIPVRMTREDYADWMNERELWAVAEVFKRYHRSLIYTPILHPSYMNMRSERDSKYPTRLDKILDCLQTLPLPGKRVIDIGCNIGYYARYFSREGAMVTGIDPMPEHYELAQALNKLERVPFDLRLERFESAHLPESYDIGLLLTVFYHIMNIDHVREAFLRQINQTVHGLLFWESGGAPDMERSVLLNGTHFNRYEKLAVTEGTGKRRELGVFFTA
ncbi:methyltransferase domain-containing protein [Paenibacillus cisolokensis]|uniref:methyltransferase domain-containing protein n=1 Tax=Paenibacillus cisolokensis TaxID=1658519 RepID=UPI003D2B3C43